MCRALPGPRCSGASRTFLRLASSNLEEAISGGNEERIAKAQKRYDAALTKFENTPAYEKEIRAKAKELSEEAATEKNPSRKISLERRSVAEMERAEEIRKYRMASRAAARKNKIATWVDENGKERYMSQATAGSLYNASVVGEDVNVRGIRGNISKAERVKEHISELSKEQKEALEKFKKEGFSNHEKTHSDFSRAYHAGMEPEFHPVNKSFLPKTAVIETQNEDGEIVKKKISLSEIDGDRIKPPMMTTVRIHDDNGLTHEAKVTIATMKGDDGKYYTVQRIRGASSLYGNRAAQDDMDASDRGALLRTDSPKWKKTVILSSGDVKRKQAAETNKALRSFTVKVNDPDTPEGRISPKLARQVSSLGTASINRRVRRGEPISQTSLDLTRNYSQTSTTK